MQRIEVAACDDIDGVRDRDSNKLSVTASVFIEAEKHVRRYPSVAADTGTSIRTAQVYIYIYICLRQTKSASQRATRTRAMESIEDEIVVMDGPWSNIDIAAGAD